MNTSILNRTTSSVSVDPTKFRNTRGCSKKNFNNFPLMAANEADGPFGVELFIQQQVHHARHDIGWLLDVPGIACTLNNYESDLDPLNGIDVYGAWKYENVKQFCMELDELVVILEDVCLPSSCSSMADFSNSVYMCAGHNKPKNCSAIDYMHHTLDTMTD
ncbi:hypothetical protein ACOME3_001160 [Neoechinorhynchus agilis]